ncbi:hypothetical protein DFJ77DRAFT_541769 [Powellomyces hirtus]|nr:hypothetical protein DFJ77DRAFT_541769 [Powellomyces hirtus]
MSQRCPRRNGGWTFHQGSVGDAPVNSCATSRIVAKRVRPERIWTANIGTSVRNDSPAPHRFPNELGDSQARTINRRRRENGSYYICIDDEIMGSSALPGPNETTLPRMMEELAELLALEDDAADAMQRLMKLEDRVKQLWNRPDGPGYDQAKADFESENRSISMTVRIASGDEHSHSFTDLAKGRKLGNSKLNLLSDQEFEKITLVDKASRFKLDFGAEDLHAGGSSRGNLSSVSGAGSSSSSRADSSPFPTASHAVRLPTSRVEPIGTEGSTTLFFVLTDGIYFSWSALREARSLAFNSDGIFRINGEPAAKSQDNRNPLPRIAQELEEVNAKEEALRLADVQVRLKHLEKQIDHLWHQPGGPAYHEAKREFEELQGLSK